MTATRQHGSAQYGGFISAEPLFQVLHRAASEAATLAADLTQLDHEIGKMLEKVNDMDSTGFHCADSIRQGLEGLSQFLMALSGSVDPAVTCDPAKAASGLGMRAQVRRLAPGLDLPSDGQASNSELW